MPLLVCVCFLFSFVLFSVRCRSILSHSINSSATHAAADVLLCGVQGDHNQCHQSPGTPTLGRVGVEKRCLQILTYHAQRKRISNDLADFLELTVNFTIPHSIPLEAIGALGSFLWLADLSATNILILLKWWKTTAVQRYFSFGELRNVGMAIAKPIQRKGLSE